MMDNKEGQQREFQEREEEKKERKYGTVKGRDNHHELKHDLKKKKQQ